MASPDYATAISSIESGGEKNPYTALGPPTASGDRAYGRFQIMGSNIPAWTEKHYGTRLTPEQFLANPDAQIKTFNGQFGEYVGQYGPEGAAQAWIGGPGGVGKVDRKDGLGTSIGAYGRKFMTALGQQPGNAAPAAQGSPPVPGLSQGMPAYGFSPNNAPAGSSVAPSPGPMAGMTSPQPSMPDQPALADLHAQMMAPSMRRPPDLTQLRALLQRTQPQPAGFRFSRT